MTIKNISSELFSAENQDIISVLKNNFNNKMIEKLYLLPKNIDKNLIEKKLSDERYINKVLNSIKKFKNKNIENLIIDKLKFYENDTNYKIEEGKMFIIIGLDTTTIYSTNIDGEDVTILLLESTDGDEDTLDMLLAHEFTHFIRKQQLAKDIFEESIGERFITEGIASNYSREIVPNKKDSEYCIVSEDTVEWVKNNLFLIEEHMKNKRDTSELMYDYFYMYADINITGIPPRTGYVYGYLKVKQYLENNNLKIKDILEIDWRKVI